MNFRINDILIRKSKDTQTVWVNQRLLMDVVQLSDGYMRRIRSGYKKSVQPCHQHHSILPTTGKSWRYAKINNQVYYDLKHLPNRKPHFIRDLFGDLDTLLINYNNSVNNQHQNSLELHFKYHQKKTYKDYLNFYSDCTSIQQKSLSIACAIIESCIKWIDDNEIDLSKNTLFKEYSELLEKYDIRYLPYNYRKFKAKILEVIENSTPIVEVVKLPRSGNNNALTYIDEEVNSWALQLRSMGQNYSNDSIIRRVRFLCRLTDKAMPSRRWFGQNVFETHNTKFLTASSRFGKGERGSHLYESYIPFKNALFAGDCWQVDATRMNLVAHKTEAGGKNFLFIIAVRDVHSGDVLGYNFDYKEDRWSVLNAVKMAVKEAQYLPYEIVFDRFPGHNTEEAKRLFATLEQMGVKITFTHKATGKAGLERWFGTLQSVFMDCSEYYYGEGVKSKRLFAHRSPEHLKEVRKTAHKSGFDMHDSWRESMLIVEAYRETAFSYYSRKYRDINKSPKTLHAESDKPHVKFLKEWQISMIFGLKKKKKMSNNGLIHTEIQKIDYWYLIDNYDIISQESEIILSYDLDDLSKVHIFKKKHHLLVYLGEAKEHEPAQIYGPQAEFNKLAASKSRNKAIDDRRTKELDSKTKSHDEVALLMGAYTVKQEAEVADTVRLLNQSEDEVFEHKKTVGSDVVTTNSDNIDPVTQSRTQY
ncbi:MAG: transposase [Urechidicola sp.]|nr:transposase [Urechidicola sp.]